MDNVSAPIEAMIVSITEMSIVVDVAHWPAVGVNVYVVVPATAVLIVAGLHVPVIPLSEVPERVPGVISTQYGPRAVNVGVTFAFTVTFIIVVVAHWPTVGVKLYVVVPAEAVLIVAGLQVPVIALVEVPGNVPGVSPTQYGPKAVNAGVTFIFTATSIVAFVAH